MIYIILCPRNLRHKIGHLYKLLREGVRPGRAGPGGCRARPVQARGQGGRGRVRKGAASTTTADHNFSSRSHSDLLSSSGSPGGRAVGSARRPPLAPLALTIEANGNVTVHNTFDNNSDDRIKDDNTFICEASAPAVAGTPAPKVAAVAPAPAPAPAVAAALT